MSVHDGHRKRMLSKFLEYGIDSLHPHEMLEILLYYAIPRRDTNPLAHELIRQFGSIRAVFDAPYEELLRIPGVGPSAATLIKMIPQMARVYLQEEKDIHIIRHLDDLIDYLKPKFIGRTRETLYVLCLDSKNKILACVQTNEGVVNFASVSTRRIAEIALKHNAAAIVMAHNHPSGSALPSHADIDSTRSIQQFCHGLDIPLLDHIIVADNDCVSLRESGLLMKYL